MTIGFPQPRVRALFVASVLLLAGLVGCSSGGKSNAGSGGTLGRGGAGGITASGGMIGSGGTMAASGGRVGMDGGSPDHSTTMLAGLGQPCTTGAECSSTYCADGVCCNSACAGVCVSCAATNSVGICLPAAENTDPRKDCTDEGAASCGKNGTCDGTGACQLYVAGVA